MHSAELELIFHKLDGLAFQAFFNDLMSWGIPGFCPIRQRNDGGNDGFVRDTGTYYQVYAPEAITRSTIENASSKIFADFHKLIKNWHYLIKLREYVFVFNDKFQGVDKSLIAPIENISKTEKIQTKILTSRHLVEIFLSIDPEKQEALLARHSIGTASDPAITVAAKIISKRLPITKWRDLDEQLSFSAIFESDLTVLSEIASKLFSMDFTKHEKELIDGLIESIRVLVNLFNTRNIRSINGERAWDNSWKSIPNNPNARFYDNELEKWTLEVQRCTFSLCKHLNLFAKHIRQHHIPNFLEYQNYTVTRRTSDNPFQYTEIIP
ncbi:hypothetical protein QE250_04785 [Chromatiaceae bacterium AAb-1]|nr:hypothetical protein [Chromatiaceae bacterium AAb-1]